VKPRLIVIAVYALVAVVGIVSALQARLRRLRRRLAPRKPAPKSCIANMKRNIAAFTETDRLTCPDYVSINDEGLAGVSITMRGVGITTGLALTRDEFIAIADQIAAWRAQQ
jgi:hypothetical protein